LKPPISIANGISHHKHKFFIQQLYLMIARQFILFDQASAGNIVDILIFNSFNLAIGQLDSLTLKSATLSTNIFRPAFIGLHF
jgi:translation elongation factor EF-G